MFEKGVGFSDTELFKMYHENTIIRQKMDEVMSFSLDKSFNHVPYTGYTATSVAYNPNLIKILNENGLVEDPSRLSRITAERYLNDPIIQESVNAQLAEQEASAGKVKNAGCRNCAHYKYQGGTDFCDTKKLEKYNHLTGDITYIYCLPCSAKNSHGDCEEFADKEVMLGEELDEVVVAVQPVYELTWRDRVWVLIYKILHKIYERL